MEILTLALVAIVAILVWSWMTGKKGSAMDTIKEDTAAWYSSASNNVRARVEISTHLTVAEGKAALAELGTTFQDNNAEIDALLNRTTKETLCKE